jgi:hypothetical protein
MQTEPVASGSPERRRRGRPPVSDEPSIAVNLTVPKSLHERASSLARANGLTVGDIIRLAMARALNPQKVDSRPQLR